MTESQKIFLNALNSIPGVGYHSLKYLGDYFGGDFEAAYNAAESQLREAGLRKPETEAILNGRDKINPDHEFGKLWKEGIKMIAPDENGYPRFLKEIPQTPSFLYVRGELKQEDDFSFGVVGTRLATDYGKETAFKISSSLAKAGLTIVSGLAYGVDTAAHQGALASSGRTIAVVASGLDENSLFPQENVGLARKIVENGALISEFPVGMKADPEKFVSRNRIISGLSRGVLIVEAPLRSGALITARHALEQNREVFAVPGNIFSRMSFGTNLLLKQGASLVTRAEDILQELNLEFKVEAGPRMPEPQNEVEEKILSIIETSSSPRHIDEIVREAGIPVSRVSAVLTSMEMKGIIKNLGGGKFGMPQLVSEINEEIEKLNFRKDKVKDGKE